MRIVYHLGAHCTDEERLVRCLLKNRAVLAAQNIIVPSPLRYRRLLRDTAVQLKGASATVDTQAMILDQIMDEDSADRLILSWDSFLSFPQWALRGSLYGYAGERIRAFTRIFPEIEAEFHLAIRNPATFLPDLFDKQKGKTYEEFLGSLDPTAMRWSTVISQILDQNEDVQLVVWCDEDTPLIWADVLQAVSGHDAETTLSDTDELLSMIMLPDGLMRLNRYLAAYPPDTPEDRRRILAAFLEKFARPDKLEIEFSLPGWTDDLVRVMTEHYHADVAQIRQMPGVTFLGS